MDPRLEQIKAARDAAANANVMSGGTHRYAATLLSHADYLIAEAEAAERYRTALERIRSVVGTSTEAWHFADAALREGGDRE